MKSENIKSIVRVERNSERDLAYILLLPKIYKQFQCTFNRILSQ
jgi:hypothetical protein